MAREKDESKTKLSYSELHDIPKVSITEAHKHVLLSLKNRQRRGTIVLVGESGIGKSQIFEQIAREEKVKVYPVYTAHYGLMGAGIPVTKDVQEGFFKVAVPEGFPKPGERAIVLFDEINKGLRHSIDMFFTMMEAGVLFNYVLPDDALVCATMNPSTANYMVTQIDTDVAFRRRVKFFWVISHYKDFRKHAETTKFHASDIPSLGEALACHPGVLSYYDAKPKSMYDEGARDAHKQFSCPATIQTISLDAYLMERAGIALTSDFALSRFASSIGMCMATDLCGHLKDSSATINPEDVLLHYNKIQGTIKRIIKQNMREKLSELNANVLKIMFSTTPPVSEVAPNFQNFLLSQPVDLVSAVIQRLKGDADECNARPYLVALMDTLENNDAWTKLMESLDDNHRSMVDELRGDVKKS
jgi:hypothetical protein